MWCIVSGSASAADLQNGLSWACGPMNVDCLAIQPSQPCFEPNSLASHASYAFNSYYQQNGATDIACTFGGAGVRTNKNPSYDNCMYTTFGNNKTVAANSTLSPSTSSSSVQGISVCALGFMLMASFSFL
ncbi:glucan endo-1 3-beta-glucosidase 13 [Phtheirospermum japonicum]|uniref:Glucan endo-1 3-beta-glucosidase 13 n=1 Tax=Phtheirospermum japonicum TaxID=374723 RepID=A0A830CF86_9LAMI|nr:glucan endo-1 3-beta-glucosidase 13 [Phtheirospermum japonicum]